MSPTDKELELAVKLSYDIALTHKLKENPDAAIGDGQFILALMELIKILLPIILEMLVKNRPT